MLALTAGFACSDSLSCWCRTASHSLGLVDGIGYITASSNACLSAGGLERGAGSDGFRHAQFGPHAHAACKTAPSPAHLLVGCEEEVGLKAPDKLSTPREVVRRPMDMFRWGDIRGRGAATPPLGCSWLDPMEG